MSYNSPRNGSNKNHRHYRDRNKQSGRTRAHNRFPDRWLDYDPVGRDIPGTRIVAFKTPLSPSFFIGMEEEDDERFEVRTLMNYARAAGKNLGLVIDLTNTNRYYNSQLWNDYGVEYVKIRCPGHEINKHELLVENFIAEVQGFFEKNMDNDKIVGVHCTHGLNRTGYLICRYLIKCHGWSPKKAIEEFELYRGHSIERKAYIETLSQQVVNSGELLRPPITAAANEVDVPIDVIVKIDDNEEKSRKPKLIFNIS